MTIERVRRLLEELYAVTPEALDELMMDLSELAQSRRNSTHGLTANTVHCMIELVKMVRKGF